MTLTFGSVCSGIEAASVAWDVLGWKAAWLAEVDKAASQVLAYRFPDVPNHGDMLLLAAKVRRREIPAPDILVGGTPCQSFSVAGMRKGLDDPRGQLTIAFIDLANAIDEIRAADGLPPVIIVWENVPGVLTHKDNPFGCFLAGVAGEDDVLVPAGRKWTNAGAVFGPERAVAWRLLDAQYFGLAQRRRRVFVVASAREGFDPAAILLEFDGVRRDSPPRRETGEGVTHPVAPCLTSSGRGVERTGDPRGQDAVVDDSDDGGPAGVDPRVEPAPTWWDGRDVSQTLDAVLHKGQTMPEKNRFPAVLHPIHFYHTNRQPEFGNSIDLAGSLKTDPSAVCHPICFSSKDYGADAQDDLSPTLRAGGHADSHANAGVPPAVAYSVALRGREGGATAELGDDLAGCLRASTGGGDKPHVLAPVDGFSTSGDGFWREGVGPLRAREQDSHENVVCVTEPVTHTLKAEGFDASEDGTGCGQPIVAATLEASAGRSRGAGTPVSMLASHTMAVRRLMPVECERLQGFPDNWTAVPVKRIKREKMKPANSYVEIDGEVWQVAADGPRYKQCGNSMATTVMRWIGGRIAHHLATLQPGHNGGPPLDDPLAAVLG